jgi:hypothetical protein
VAYSFSIISAGRFRGESAAPCLADTHLGSADGDVKMMNVRFRVPPLWPRPAGTRRKADLSALSVSSTTKPWIECATSR